MKHPIAIFLIVCMAQTGHTQFISARATHATGIVSDNLFTSDISKSIGGEIYFSKSLNFIPVNYNLGVNYVNTDGIQSVYAITGLSFIFRTPSGFSATNPENVTYYTNNWLNYADVNFMNGVQLQDSVAAYAMAGELGYNIGYLLGKQFFIHTGFGGRYSLIPSNKETANEFSSVDFLLKVGVLWKIQTQRYKP